MIRHFPVLVTGYQKYVVWVDAEDADAAHQVVQDTPYEWVDGVQAVEGWLEAEKVDETADYLWGFGPADFLPQHDAHVHTHNSEMWRREREAKRAACAAAGHPEREAYTDGPIWCKGCSEYLKVEVAR